MATVDSNELGRFIAQLSAMEQRHAAEGEELRLLRTQVMALIQSSTSNNAPLASQEHSSLDSTPTQPDKTSSDTNQAALPAPPASSQPAISAFDSLVKSSAEFAHRKQHEAAAPVARSAGGAAQSPSSPPKLTDMPGQPTTKQTASKVFKAPGAGLNLEKFVGENLINKIGIIITVLGVGIGAKYAIDHELISPLTRIILGYLLGAGFFVMAGRLKERYEAFSAVLLSGAMAILYFITFAAYSFYALMPQALAFGLMVLFTLYTVVAAMQYQRQVIAIIGLVGAYAVPILLSDGSGRVEILFSYMTIINAGILFVAWKRFWPAVTALAVILTWLMYLSWYDNTAAVFDHFSAACVFATVFFAELYAAIMGLYRQQGTSQYRHASLLLYAFNTLTAYAVGMHLLSLFEPLRAYQGLFTLANALVHFAVLFRVYRAQNASSSLIATIGSFVLFFITIAIPVQLHGSWISVAWAVEGLAVYSIGTRQKARHAESIAVLIMFIAVISVIKDWQIQSQLFRSSYSYNSESIILSQIPPFVNGAFLSMILVIAALTAWLIQCIRSGKIDLDVQAVQRRSFTIAAASTFLAIVVYGTFYVQIDGYYQQWWDSVMQVSIVSNVALLHIWSLQLINYSLAFVIALLAVAERSTFTIRVRSFLVALSVLALLAMLVGGLSLCSALTSTYISAAENGGGDTAIFNGQLSYRYLSFVLTAGLLWFFLRLSRPMEVHYRRLAVILAHITAIAVLSNELLHWLNLWHFSNADRSAMSILWGSYSLVLIGVGIQRKDKVQRLIAIALFFVTLIKLFVYDLNELGAMAKTVAFIALGLLLLVISFLYNKYKSRIFEDAEDATTTSEHNEKADAQSSTEL